MNGSLAQLGMWNRRFLYDLSGPTVDELIKLCSGILGSSKANETEKILWVADRNKSYEMVNRQIRQNSSHQETDNGEQKKDRHTRIEKSSTVFPDLPCL